MSNADYTKYMTYGINGIPYFYLERSSFLTHKEVKDPLHEFLESLVILGYLNEATYYGLANSLRTNTFNYLHLINNDEDKYSHVNMRFIVNIIEALSRSKGSPIADALLDSLKIAGIVIHRPTNDAISFYSARYFAIDLWYLDDYRINAAEKVFNDITKEWEIYE